MNLLVTGGTGYLGSHIVLELLDQNHDVTVIDNLVNSSAESLRRVEELTNKKVSLHEFDLRDAEQLDAVFTANSFDTVIHLAGLKAVGESVHEPTLYYDNNLVSTIRLIEMMEKHNVRSLIFSSSAVVYGDPSKVPITEDMPVQPTNPYGQTKAMIEQMLCDLTAVDKGWQITILRYFNPIGAHESGMIGEDPHDIPNNLMPFVAQVAVGKRDKLRVFGNDYSTPDGTGVRDYIHVVDVAKGHLAALDRAPEPNNFQIYNLGSGAGVSVMELIKTFEQASGKKVPYEVVARRLGDIDACYADPGKANHELKWHTEKSLLDACRDTWNWQSKNPNGYA